MPWFTKVIAKKEKEPATAEQLAEEALAVAEQEALLQIEDPAISKRITEEDKVKVVVDPDFHDDDDFEIENTVSKKDVELSIEDMLFDHVPEAESPNPTTKVKEPELQVAEKVADELADDDVVAAMGDYDPTLDLSSYKYPTIDLLDDHASGNAEVSNEELISNKNKIVETLRHYKIEITKIRGNHWTNHYAVRNCTGSRNPYCQN